MRIHPKLVTWAQQAQHRGDGWHEDAARMVLGLADGTSTDRAFEFAALSHWARRAGRYSPDDREAASLVRW
jgi:hypothetical protein